MSADNKILFFFLFPLVLIVEEVGKSRVSSLLSAAANLLFGKTDKATPITIIRGLDTERVRRVGERNLPKLLPNLLKLVEGDQTSLPLLSDTKNRGCGSLVWG
jgi:hypothetical protein